MIHGDVGVYRNSGKEMEATILGSELCEGIIPPILENRMQEKRT